MLRLMSAVGIIALAACVSPDPSPTPSPSPSPSASPSRSPSPSPSPSRSLSPSPREAQSAIPVTWEPYTFTANDGTKVEAQKGSFEVPENRSVPGSGKIRIGFVRLPSTSPNPGDPIVYLAGGPGGTGVASLQGLRFPLAQALRSQADVIAYDQRGTGLSSPTPICPANPPFDMSQTITRASLTVFMRERLSKCFDFWKSKGIDIDGYTTLQNADDIEDLRRALGAQKLNLWGISYGSHLGLTILKYHGGSVNKAVLSGIEGLDQTVKRPAMTDKMFAHVQEIIDADPAAKAAYPDLAGMIRRVTARLNAKPATVTFTPQGADKPVTLTFDGYAVQMLTAQSIADPPAIAQIPRAWYAGDKGNYELAARNLYNLSRQLAAFRGMPEAMDLASGATAARLTLVEKEAKTSLLSDTLNFPMPHVMGIRPGIDLGDSFRAPFTSGVPAMFISATLDGRTYPDEAAEEIKGFSNKHWLIVENGGHNIYEADKRVADAVIAFFKGEPVPNRIVMAPPKIALP